MKRFIALSIILSIMIPLFFVFTPVQAQNLQDQVMGQVNKSAEKAEIGKAIAPQDVVSGIIVVVLGTVGAVFTALIVYGGFMFFTSGGDEEKAKKGKNLITGAVIGLIIVLLSYAITIFVANKIKGAATSGAGPSPKAEETYEWGWFK